MNNFSKTLVLILTILVVGVAGVVSSQTTTPEIITEDNLAEEIVDSATTTEALLGVVEENATTTEAISSTNSIVETLNSELVTESVVDSSATNTAPFVSITSPLGEKNVSGVITISAQASDKESGVVVQFFLDERELGQPMFKEPYVIQDWHSTGTPNGVHTLKAVAYDTEGKTAESNLTITFANDEADIKLAPELVAEPTLVLQASGGPEPKVKSGLIKALVLVENVSSCKLCYKSSPETIVKIYVTPWYPNDGPQNLETISKYAEQNFSVPVIARGRTYEIAWSGTVTTPGKYYFVAVVDPDNTLGAYRMTQSVFEAQ